MNTTETVRAALEALEVSAPLRWRDEALHDAVRAKHASATAGLRALLAQAETAQPAPVNVRERWNVEWDGNDLLVCFNDHEKGDKCDYKRYRLASSMAQPSSQWQDIATAPKDVAVLVYVALVDETVRAHKDDNGVWHGYAGEKWISAHATHWRPMPPPPPTTGEKP